MKNLSFIFVSLLFSACTTFGPKQMTDHGSKVDMGFGFLPPQTTGWYETRPEGILGYAYGKKVDGVDPKIHSIVFAVQYGAISTGLSKPEEILNFVKMQKENALQGIRFEVKKDQSRFVTFKGAKCLEFDSVARDKRANQDMTIAGMFCVHPEDHKRYVDISYSQRHDLARPPVDIREEGEQFVKSVNFLPIK